MITFLVANPRLPAARTIIDDLGSVRCQILGPDDETRRAAILGYAQALGTAVTPMGPMYLTADAQLVGGSPIHVYAQLATNRAADGGESVGATKEAT